MLKKIFAFLSLLTLSPLLMAAVGGPAGNFIRVQTTLQPGSTFYVSSGTVNSLTLSTITFSDGSVQTTAGGGGGATVLDDLTDVDDSSRQTNYALLFNGSQWVAAAQGTSFAFTIATFADNQSSTIEMGTANGPWLTAGNMTFTATYNNGPPIGSTVTHSGWSSLPMTSSFLGPTSNVDIASYPASVGSKTWTLTAQKGAETDTEVITINFYTKRFWGVSTVASGFTESNVESLANNELSNSKAKTFSLTPGSGEYILYAYPTRLGTATFTVGGFEGGFNSPETVSITNPSGFTENYYVYRSINSNLGSTTVVAN